MPRNIREFKYGGIRENFPQKKFSVVLIGDDGADVLLSSESDMAHAERLRDWLRGTANHGEQYEVRA